MFQFKQFSVDQSGCAMKINTDGVLLGALVTANYPVNILDIGTGTGVIALMLAQRYSTSKIDTVEIDESAAETAAKNFKESPFADQLTSYALGFESYFDQFPERKYDLIVSNPPFYINSLKSPGAKKALAKHTDDDFFERLIKCISTHLTPDGSCWLILPVGLTEIVAALAVNYFLYPKKIINVQSFEHSQAHRTIICLGFTRELPETTKFIIYKAIGIYSEEYIELLKPYFIAF